MSYNFELIHFLSLLGSGTGKVDSKRQSDFPIFYRQGGERGLRETIRLGKRLRTLNSQGDTRQLPNSQDKPGEGKKDKTGLAGSYRQVWPFPEGWGK